MERKNMFINEDNNSIMPSFRIRIQNEQMDNCFFTPIWGNSVDQNDPFESALSSMVSSPATSNAAAAPPPAGFSNNDSIVLKELIGRLGGIYNSGEVSPQSYMNGNNSSNNSCYNTPLNSPPKLNLSIMDHQIRGKFQTQLADRAARYSCFSDSNLGGLNGQQILGLNETELQERMESKVDQSILKISGSHMFGVQENTDGGQKSKKQELGDSGENTSVSEQNPGGETGLNGPNDLNSKKRKSSNSAKETNATTGKVEVNAKRNKSGGKSKNEESNSDNSGGNGSKKEGKDKQKSTEPPKDYIHVRARRGQATDAHSLAERVRREKISQRMNFLQDLVPGCNKVTGKTVMLDEIINYVQSLQQQVEFLSMKLATIDPRMDVNLEGLLPKDMFQSCDSVPNSNYALNNSAATYPFLFQSQQVQNLHINGVLGPNMQHPIVEITKENQSQGANFFEDDLQSLIFGKNQAKKFQGEIPSGQMKVEL